MSKRRALAGVDQIVSAIYVVRGHRIMLDVDLAALYRVTTGRLNEQVKRNRNRFPPDFRFRLTPEELAGLKSQTAISNRGRGGRRKLPNAFTEHGALMLASVLKSPVAVHASIYVVGAFLRLRAMLATHPEFARKLEELERKYDAQFKVVFGAIRELMRPPPSPARKQIGFRATGLSDDRGHFPRRPVGS